MSGNYPICPYIRMSNNPQAQKQEPLRGIVPCVAVAFGRQVTRLPVAHRILLLYKVELSAESALC
jgi:hypothetical protein